MLDSFAPLCSRYPWKWSILSVSRSSLLFISLTHSGQHPPPPHSTETALFEGTNDLHVVNPIVSSLSSSYFTCYMVLHCFLLNPFSSLGSQDTTLSVFLLSHQWLLCPLWDFVLNKLLMLQYHRVQSLALFCVLCTFTHLMSSLILMALNTIYIPKALKYIS